MERNCPFPNLVTLFRLDFRNVSKTRSMCAAKPRVYDLNLASFACVKVCNSNAPHCETHPPDGLQAPTGLRGVSVVEKI